MISPNRTELMWLASGLAWFFLASPLLIALSMRLGLWPQMSFWIVMICFLVWVVLTGIGLALLLSPGGPRDGNGRPGGRGDRDRAGDPASPGDHVRFSHRTLRPASWMRRSGLPGCA
jgi:hypothetical protein